MCICSVQQHDIAKHQKKHHRSLNAGIDQYHQSATTKECGGEIGALDSVDVQKDAFSSTADSGHVEYCDRDAELYQQSCPEKYADNCDSEFSTRKRFDKKKKSTKLWRIVSSSDEEADTLKDRFWRNLEEGVLPEELGGADLYSSVCGFHLIACVCCTALFQGSCAALNSRRALKRRRNLNTRKSLNYF